MSCMDLWGIAGIAYLSCLAGCTPAPTDTAAVTSPITHGTTDEGHPAVTALLRKGKVVCTGVLVGRHTVLTAAHCISDGPVTSVAFGSDPHFGSSVNVSRVTVHPQFELATLRNDIAALELGAPGPEPLPWLFDSVLMTTLRGSSVDVVGFGRTAPFDGSPSMKRSGTALVSEIGAETISLAPAASTTCFKDSGGPALVKLDREYVVGIASHGDSLCEFSSVHSRVDIHREFIERRLLEASIEHGCSLPGKVDRPNGSLLVVLAVLGYRRRRTFR